MAKYNDITELIGDTPLVKVDPEVTGLENIEVYAKLEYYNPFGSIKDRVGHYLLKDHLEELKAKDKKVVESSSGNTAKAIKTLTEIHGLDFKTITNRIKVDNVKDSLLVLGTEMEEIPGGSECPDPTDPDDPLSQIEKLVQQNPDKYFHSGQYTSENNTKAHYETTGKEINEDLDKVDFLFGGLGTSGSTKGVAQALKEENSDIEVYGIVSDPSDFIPGIRSSNEMWEVGLFKRSLYNDFIEVDSIEALDSMVKLIKKTGIMGGPTTGANFHALIQRLQEIDPELEEKKTAVFFACDRYEPYTDYVRERKGELFGEKKEKKGLQTLTDEEIENAPTVNIEKAEKMIEDPDTLVVDIRSPRAFKAMHIPHSINMPKDHLSELYRNASPFAECNKVLFVCPVGEMSKRFAAMESKKGREAYSLEEGLTLWREAGLTLHRGD